MKLAPLVAAAFLALCAPACAAEHRSRSFHSIRASAAVAKPDVVLEIHGGGWAEQAWMEPAAYAYEAPRWPGWQTISISYVEGAGSFQSALATYDAVRPLANRLVVTGQSAGGQIALMIGAVRDPTAIVVEGAPTDLTVPLPPYLTQVVNYWHMGYPWYSPALLPLTAKHVLLGMSACDTLVPAEQMSEYATAHPSALTYTLPCGDVQFTHGNVSAEGLAEFGNLTRKVLGL